MFVVADAHFDGFALLVGTVVHRVDHGLLDGGVRKIPDPRGLGPIRVLSGR